MKLIVLAPLVALLSAALLAACSTPAAAPTPTPTPTPAEATPTPTPTQPPGGAGGGGDFTPVPITTPFPSPSPVPADWATYSQAASEKSPGFTFSYPPTWFVGGGEKLQIPAYQDLASTCSRGIPASPGTNPGTRPTR